MIDQIEKPKIERVEIGENNRYGKFVVNPLERGFGQTLGNSLRRVLLNSLPGVAATSVRIEGVQHEFSTVPGVKEDVAELILNIKLLSAKLFTEHPKIVSIDAHGPCEVTAGDIRIDDEVEIINPELHIATLSEGAHGKIQLLDGHLQNLFLLVVLLLGIIHSHNIHRQVDEEAHIVG